ncbi:DNA replication/repair protein RecF [Polymorphobacter sp. PAMC 29334]|uniref:DNA replication/repair protein RecF n=1 Tax=Polymorphobacter sp. PAMC 29334 TaxID=2862331 RepID=UPI001C7696C7|nr:DNA replication/repair protein RecF [Polymorphobacter sp. PAMC 29334]QYE36057.1 DNA replication/repair protein RecF [Polymorphobacter sp. PAMC 29334]
MSTIARLTLTDFRSHVAADIALKPRAIVITGDNGQGKTNLLDAVSLLSPGRGLRGVALSDAARSDGPGGWTIAAEVAAPGGAVQIGTGTDAAAPDRRVVRINGAAAPIARLGEWLGVLWLTPAMDRLFVDTASARRRFLDRLVLALEPGHGGEVTRYDAAMRARTRLLTGELSADPVWLAGLERAMAEHGAAVARAREATVAALGDALAVAPGDFPRATVTLDMQASPDLAATLARNRAVDAAAGRATAGPHRADLIVTNAAKAQPAARSSTGEQKALLLGLVLAHAGLVASRTGRPPILLLDEVAAHLDPARRGALFDRLAAGGGQVWLTGTEAELFAGLDAQRLVIAHGIVAQ